MDPDQDSKLSHLLALGQQGDRDAYQLFLVEAAAALRRRVWGRVRRRDEAEDVLQDTLLAIHRGRHSYSPGRPIAPWLYAICENRIVDSFRKRRRAEKLETAWGLERNEAHTGTAEDCRTDTVLAILEKLPRHQKRIIELLKLRELPVSQVATLTGMSTSAVKVTAFRGYEKVRQLLGLKKQ